MTIPQSITSVKRCTKCGEVKPLADFYPRKRTHDGVDSWCKFCSRASAAASQEARYERRWRLRRATLGDIIAPDSRIIGADERDWSWAFVCFKEVSGHPGYVVGTNQTVWCCRVRGFGNGRLSDRWNFVKPCPNSVGYLYVRLYRNDGRSYPRTVHSILAETFLGPRPPGMEVCHNDGNGLNNDINNLRWDTRKGNFADKRIHGTLPQGSRVGTSKLKEEDIPFIRSLAASGVASSEIARRYGIDSSTVRRVVARKIWNHVP